MSNRVNFKDLEYKRPNYDEVNETIDILVDRIKEANNFSDIRDTIESFEKIYANMHTNITIAMIRAYLDSSNEYYNVEMQDCMQKEATINYTKFYNAILNSNFTDEINKEYGEQALIKLRDNILIKSNGIELLAKEQELLCQYQHLKATIKIEFNGEVLSEGEINKYITDKNRNIRRDATIALHKAFINRKDDFNSILSQLVKVRNELAEVNGFSSFVDYMNIEKGRRDYGQNELLQFCNHVKEELVEFTGLLNSRQAKRLGLKTMSSYDCALNFINGNAKPVGNGVELMEIAKEMYADLSVDISEMYNAMVEGEYIDVTESPNKISGMGFCTELFTLNFPYVFGNCNGSFHDVDVLTHEIGHAYQAYLSLRNQPLYSYASMPNDVAEIPSKTMEHFTQDYAEIFFGEDADKFRFQFLEQSLSEILTYCTIHEFESWLYSNPQASYGERTKMYYEYMTSINPGVDYSEIEEYALEGSFLFRSMGVYMFPFYVISYAISAISAMEFAKRISEDKNSTWEDYKNLCEAGGSLSYTKLLKVANLHLPFEKSTIKNNIGFIKNKISKVSIK